MKDFISIKKIKGNMKILFVIACLVILLPIAMFLNKTNIEKGIILSGGTFPIEVVSTESDMERGLGIRKEIGTTGMLFIFGKEDRHGIWMKDMQFAIDILWLNEDYKVVSIAENVSPLTFPKVFYPSRLAFYVFEAKSGFVKENKIEEGDKLRLSL